MKREFGFWVYSGRAILIVMLAFSLSFCGHSSSKSSSSCSSGRVKCGSVCCQAGQTCVDNACEWPYTSATLYIYFCPNFYNEGCGSDSFNLNGSCISASPVAGSCNNTGFIVYPNTTYSFSNCIGCPGNCSSNTITFTTPDGFAEPYYYPAGWWRCNTDCTAPSDCP